MKKISDTRNKTENNYFLNNFGEENIKNVRERTEIPSKVYTMIEGQFGTTEVHTSAESMKKTAKLLMD